MWVGVGGCGYGCGQVWAGVGGCGRVRVGYVRVFGSPHDARPPPPSPTPHAVLVLIAGRKGSECHRAILEAYLEGMDLGEHDKLVIFDLLPNRHIVALSLTTSH